MPIPSQCNAMPSIILPIYSYFSGSPQAKSYHTPSTLSSVFASESVTDAPYKSHDVLPFKPSRSWK